MSNLVMATKTHSFLLIDDNLVEGDETIDLRLENLVDGTNGQVTIAPPAERQIVIVDNDVATIAFADGASEVAEDGGPLTINVVLSVPGEHD